MNDESYLWLRYAQENQRMAEMALRDGLYNPSLQNAQQAAEKALKAISLFKGLILKKTHSIRELHNDLKHIGINVNIEEEECELLDSIYLPSKYPLGLILPDYHPDEKVARRCLAMADKVLAAAKGILLS